MASMAVVSSPAWVRFLRTRHAFFEAAALTFKALRFLCFLSLGMECFTRKKRAVALEKAPAGEARRATGPPNPQIGPIEEVDPTTAGGPLLYFRAKDCWPFFHEVAA